MRKGSRTIARLSPPSVRAAVAGDRGARATNPIIYDRRSSMEVVREHAAVWASWFRALGDPSRIVILNVVATAGQAMTVGEIVERVEW